MPYGRSFQRILMSLIKLEWLPHGLIGASQCSLWVRTKFHDAAIILLQLPVVCKVAPELRGDSLKLVDPVVGHYLLHLRPSADAVLAVRGADDAKVLVGEDSEEIRTLGRPLICCGHSHASTVRENCRPCYP